MPCGNQVDSVLLAMNRPRQTKIIATLGPATDAPETIRALIDAGADIFRLNMSHARHDWARRVAGHIREVAGQKPIAILADLQGPAIRTDAVDEPFQLEQGQQFTFTTDSREPGPRSVGVNYPGLADDVSTGDTILIDLSLIHI